MADTLGAVWAGGIHLVWGFVEWLSRQLFVLTAEREALLTRARSYGMAPTPATFATGNLTATGTNGSIIPVDTTIKLDAATSFRVTVSQTISGGTATVPVVAKVAGVAANLPAGTVLALESPIAGVSASLTVAADITDGFDEEGTEEFRARFLLRVQEPPAGGRDPDYQGWAEEVAGVTRAWVYPLELGLGTVVVRFVNDNAVPIFPLPGAVAAVQAHLTEERPITALVVAAAPTQLSVAFTLHLVPDTTDTRAAVTAELTDLFVRDAEPGDGAGRGTLLISQIRTAIGEAEGVTDYTMTVPSANVVPTLGQLPTVGTITWV